MKFRIPPRTGVAFELKRHQQLRVIDPQGEQVADLLAYRHDDVGEVLSSGRSIDYAAKIYLSTGDLLYSNRSSVLLEILEDTVGRHDFLLTPCSAEMFRIIYADEHPHQGCFGNLANALAPYGIAADSIPTAFNIFMNVLVERETGTVTVRPPLSRAGDSILFEAKQDLIIGLTACAAGQSNNFSYKPVDYEILDAA